MCFLWPAFGGLKFLVYYIWHLVFDMIYLYLYIVCEQFDEHLFEPFYEHLYEHLYEHVHEHLLEYLHEHLSALSTVVAATRRAAHAEELSIRALCGGCRYSVSQGVRKGVRKDVRTNVQKGVRQTVRINV